MAMEAAVGFAFNVSRDKSFRHFLRMAAGAAEGQPFYVRAFAPAWLQVDENDGIKAVRDRGQEAPWIDFTSGDDRGQLLLELDQKLEEACSRTDATRKAQRIMLPVVDVNCNP